MIPAEPGNPAARVSQFAVLPAVSGPYSLNVIVPPAGPPTTPGGMSLRIDPSPRPPVPGRLAVPLRNARSLIAWPKSTGPAGVHTGGVAMLYVPEQVSRPGVFGVILKHSDWLVALSGSLDGGTPLVVDVNSARQQYLPTLVSVTGSALTVAGLVAFVSVSVEISTPPVSQLAVDGGGSSGPHRLNFTDPLNDGTPVTVISAESLAVTCALAGISLLPEGVGVVFVVDRHSPSRPREKSNSVAVSDVDERVSAMNVLKHVGAVPPPLSANACVMLIPPSKKSGGTTVLPDAERRVRRSATGW